MKRKKESGKSRLIKGALLYLWEEIKTLNKMKFKAIGQILSGYLLMKIQKKRRIKSEPAVIKDRQVLGPRRELKIDRQPLH